MNRITNMLAVRGKRKLLAPFFTAGYPDYETSLELVGTGIDSGANLIELGMPFSDPMADGPTIQLSSQVALESGIDMHDVFESVKSIRQYSEIPIILMGYYNPVHAFGVAKFVKEAHTCGVDGLIIPDLPVEEAKELRLPAKSHGLSLLFLVAPTSSESRVRKIDRACTDLVYAVTVTGVTGGRSHFNNTTDVYLKGLRQSLSKPFVAGFGVSTPESARRLARYADGVVIGSALIEAYRSARNRQSGRRAVGRLLASIRQSLDDLIAN